MANQNQDQPSPSSSTNSMSSRKYNLSDKSTSSIIVYKLWSGRTYFTNQRDLCKELDKDGKLRCSRKPIPRGNSHVEVLTRDLYNEPERSLYAKYPNQTCSMANVGLPKRVYWRRVLFGHFDALYVLSPEGSTRVSPNESMESSGLSSPT